MAESKDGTAEDYKEKDAAYMKRREQVRRAQRTHRERKEAYIKSLETEIQQQRTNESRAHQEKRHLQTEVGRLRNILDQHGIAHGRSSIDISTAWVTSDTSVAPTTASIASYSDAHHPRSPYSGLAIPTPNEMYSSESDVFPDLENAVNPLRDVTLFQGQEDSDLESGGTSSPQRNGPLPPDISAISAYASHLDLNDVNMRPYGADVMSQPETSTPFTNQNSYYSTPLSQSPIAHGGVPSRSPSFQQYTSYPVIANNVLPSGNWSMSSATPGSYCEDTSHLSFYQYPNRPEYGSSDGGSPGNRTDEMYRQAQRPNYQG